jgi:hypothetical protein
MCSVVHLRQVPNAVLVDILGSAQHLKLLCSLIHLCQVPNAVVVDIPGSVRPLTLHIGYRVDVSCVLLNTCARCPMPCWLTFLAHLAAAAASPAAGTAAGWRLRAQMQAAGSR